jgi:hypothetical protein
VYRILVRGEGMNEEDESEGIWLMGFIYIYEIEVGTMNPLYYEHIVIKMKKTPIYFKKKEL